MRTLGPTLVVLFAAVTIAAWGAAPATGQGVPVGQGDPAKGEVPLPCAPGWGAFLVYRTPDGAGIWTVTSLQVLPRYGCPEVVGMDDRGRCTILVSYSGKWTPFQTVEDRLWFGPLARADLDPRYHGPELYTGGRAGRLYRIEPLRRGGFHTRIVSEFPGEEIHTLVGGDLLAERPGDELLVFLGKGDLFEVRPFEVRPSGGTGEGGGGDATAVRVAELPGRVRDAVVLPAAHGTSPRIATVSRAGLVDLFRMTPGGVERETILREPMGLGRIALRKGCGARDIVLYVTRDDGVALRLERIGGGQGRNRWRREVIYAGPQGLRGIASGRFAEDPGVETVAVFGYSGKVQLLARGPHGGAWRVETIFTDTDRGHWLEACELDGRNGTDEILGSGYSGRIFLLARPPGFGLEGVATDPDGERRTAQR